MRIYSRFEDNIESIDSELKRTRFYHKNLDGLPKYSATLKTQRFFRSKWWLPESRSHINDDQRLAIEKYINRLQQISNTTTFTFNTKKTETI